jgi:3',5'-cyclic AMP phosphodiesterase CpdA
MATIVHLSDLHFGRVDPPVLSSLLRTIESVTPALVAVSGDLTQRARAHQFRQARRFLDRLPHPLLVVPGNHDVPLYNLAARLLDPYGGYRRYIGDELEPFYEHDEFVAVGLNSARSVPFHGGGCLNEAQVIRAAARLEAARGDAIRIVVTHHPFDVPDTHGDADVIGRSGMAMRRLAAAGADLFLAGHLHVSHVGHSATRYQIAGHSALLVQAGTISTRTRGEVNSLNVLYLSRSEIEIERHDWEAGAAAFRVRWRGAFCHTADGWVPHSGSGDAAR